MGLPKQELAWPPAIVAEPTSTADASGAAAGKNRSPGAGSGNVSGAGTAGAPTTTRVIVDDAEFDALWPRWSALLDKCANANVFLSHEWLFSWWSAYQPCAELAIVVAEQGGRLVGIAPLMIERDRRWRLQRRVLRFIGDGTSETDHIDFLVDGQADEGVLASLLAAAVELRWDIAELNQIPEASAHVRDVLAWIDHQRWARTIVVSPCPVCHLPESFDALLARLPARLRTSVRSARKKLHQKHSVAFGPHDRSDETGAALASFFANHASRWQAKGQTGVFADARKRSFYAHLTPLLLERGWLHFYYLKLDDRVVAQQYCFGIGDTVMLLQEGFDFAHAQDNVGNVLRAMVFEHLIAERASCYDFLAGSSRHKQSWSDSTINDLRIRIARRSWRGWVFFWVPKFFERVTDVLRPLRDRLQLHLSGKRPMRSNA